MERFSRSLGYVWSVALNVAILAVVLYVFSRLQTRLETIVVSLIGLLYGAIRAIALNQGRAFAQVGMLFAHELHRVREMLGQAEDGGLAEGQAEIDRQITRAYIDVLFLTAVEVVRLYNLFTAL